MVSDPLPQGADPAADSKSGHTALSWAAVCGFEVVGDELLAHGSKGNGIIHDLTRVSSREERTALHQAAFNGNARFAMLLLDRLREMLLLNRYSARNKVPSTVAATPQVAPASWGCCVPALRSLKKIQHHAIFFASFY